VKSKLLTTSDLTTAAPIGSGRRKSQPLASSRKEKSFENLRFQRKTQQETENIKDRRSELKDEDK